MFLCSLPFLRNNQARKLGLDCLEVCLDEAESEVGWFVPWSMCVSTCIFICLIFPATTLQSRGPNPGTWVCYVWFSSVIHYCWVVLLEHVLYESVSLRGSCFRGNDITVNAGVFCEGLFWRAELDHPRWIDNAFVTSQSCKPVLWVD